VVGESRVPDVAEASRASIFEEADVGKFGHVDLCRLQIHWEALPKYAEPK